MAISVGKIIGGEGKAAQGILGFLNGFGSPTQNAKTTAQGVGQTVSGTGATGALVSIWNDVSSDAKYAAIWVGLMILAIVLIAMGISRTSGRAMPSIVPVVVPS